MAAQLRSQLQDGVLHLTLDDVATRNSLSEAMIKSLALALAAAETNFDVRVIIIKAEGPVFSSGHNLKELTAHRNDADKGLAYFQEIFGSCARLMLAICNHRCAIIAEVNGLASAAGCQLVASCDLAYASDRATFCTPGVNIGLFCSTPMVPLSRVVPAKLAMEMLLLGGIHDAAFAERVGLVNAVLPADGLSKHALAVAMKITARSQKAIWFGKRQFHQQRTLALADAYEMMAGVMVKNMLDDAACEGLDAFLNKRQANWPLLGQN